MAAEQFRWIGKPISRVEDERLMRGAGRYIDDLHPFPGCKVAAIVRSPYAHAIIRNIDVEAALQVPSQSRHQQPIQHAGLPRTHGTLAVAVDSQAKGGHGRGVFQRRHIECELPCHRPQPRGRPRRRARHMEFEQAVNRFAETRGAS